MARLIVELVVALADALRRHDKLKGLWTALPACIQAPLADDIAAISAIAAPVAPALARACTQLVRLDADALRAAQPPLPAIEPDDATEPIDPAVDAATRRTLLDACYRDPDDELAREVYADYLMLRGDPRGEMIALQLGDRDPARVAQLIATHAHKWLGPLKRRLHDVEFERGFPARARIDGWSAEMHALLHDTPAAATIRALTIERVTAADLDVLCADRAMAARIAGLRTYDVPVADVLAHLASDPFPALTALALRVGDAGAPVALRPLWGLAVGARLVELSCTSLEIVPWLELLASAPPRLARSTIVIYLHTAIEPTTVTLVRDTTGAFAIVDIVPGRTRAPSATCSCARSRRCCAAGSRACGSPPSRAGAPI